MKSIKCINYIKKYFVFINLFLLLLLITGCNQKPNSIEILKDGYSIEELDTFVGDATELTTLINGKENSDLELIWESSDKRICTVNDGVLDVVNSGNVIITVTVKDYPYINDSIILDCIEHLGQRGIGSGLSKYDPVFLGDEGKDEPIEVYFIEMQHIYADSIFIKKGNVEVLIDAGYQYDGTFVNKVLTQYCTDKRLDLFMVSHNDGDHVEGIPNALEAIDNISLMVDFGGTGTGNVKNARNIFKQRGMNYHSAYDSVNGLNGATDVYYLTKDFYFEVLDTGSYITADKQSASNPNSVAVIFHYKDFSFFTAGDITTKTEEKLLINEDLPEVTLYKASHHGSHGSNSQELLNTLNPKAVAISCARANQYQATPGGPNKNNTYNLNGVSGHPAAEAIERIYKAPNISENLNVYWNAVNGTMKFTSYGENDFTFTGSTPNKGYYDLSITGKPVWNDLLNDFENKVSGEENFKFHQTKVFKFRGYQKYLPEWAK